MTRGKITGYKLSRHWPVVQVSWSPQGTEDVIDIGISELKQTRPFSPLVLSTLIYAPKLSPYLDLPLGHAHHDKSEMTSHTSWIFMPMWIKHTPYVHFKMWVNCTVVNINIIPPCFWTSVLYWLLKTIHGLCGRPTTQIYQCGYKFWWAWVKWP